ncbi:MAG: hypothetical protein WAN36_01675 [Calditrichia bacterium]
MKRTNRINWVGYFIELLVVIIGVTAAFWLNRFEDNRRDRSLENRYLSGLQADLAADFAEMQNLLADMKKSEVSVNLLIDLLTRSEIPLDSLPPLVPVLAEGFHFAPHNTTFETMKSAAGLQIIDNFELKNRIVALYNSYEQVQFTEEIHFHFVREQITPYLFRIFNMKEQAILNRALLSEKEFLNLSLGFLTALQQQEQTLQNASLMCRETIAAIAANLERR